jgi:hypothetical protein
MPNGFFGSIEGLPYSSASTMPEKCRPCGGSGIIWSQHVEAGAVALESPYRCGCGSNLPMTTAGNCPFCGGHRG